MTANPAPALGKPEHEPDASDGYYPSAKVPGWLVTTFSVFVAAVALGLGYVVLNQFRA